ncbi:hypothetical protein [Phaeacidiphilus oryzae]|uniref:hypothetical protein n=1 Tax=Phaeacidiphilus oryzae TaxID=348818 RepID=UPI00055AF87A|nr:hypothetical protein [Phaeacidiphilus oryzae]
MVIACVLAGLLLTGWPARAALHAWREQRAGAAYELPMDFRDVYLRGGAAVAVLLCTVAGAVWAGAEGGGAAARAGAARTGAEAGVGAGTGRGADPTRDVASSAASPAGPATLPSHFVRTGAAYGGSWWAARIGGSGPTRIWVPGGRGAPRPLRVLAGPQALLPDLASATGNGYGGPFALLVGADGPDVRRAARAVLPLAGRDGGWGVIGIGAGAPEAVRRALTEPGRYAAGAGVAGRYPAPYPSAAKGAHVLLANAHRDRAGVASALRLRAAAPAAVHVSSNARDFLPARERYRLVRQALVYLTGRLSLR